MKELRYEGLRHIAEAVARFYDITLEEMQATGRGAGMRERAEARYVALVLMDKVPDVPQREIAKTLGYRYEGVRRAIRTARLNPAIAHLAAEVKIA